MTSYAIYLAATGQIRCVTNSPAAPANLDAGESYLTIPDGTVVGYRTHQVSAPGTPGAALVPYVTTLADGQFDKVQAALQYFNALFMPPNGFTYSGALYQIDPASQGNITSMGALANASLANPSAVPWPSGFYWVAADNAHVAMSASQMLAFAAAVAGYVSGCMLRLRDIKDAIATCTTEAELDALDVTGAYPAASA